MKQVIPQIYVPDVTLTVDYYSDVLGFKFMMGSSPDQQVVVTWDAEQILDSALMQCGGVEVMFKIMSRADMVLTKIPVPLPQLLITLFFEIEDIDAYFSLLKDKVRIITPLTLGNNGFKEFYIEDCNGLPLGFGERY